MRAALALLFALLSLQMEAFTSPPELAEPNQVILSSGEWKPSADEAQKALSAVQRFLDKETSMDQGSKEEIQKIREHWTDYRVQFIGVVRDGAKLIRCNFFPAPRNSEADRFLDWKQYEIIVDDGGFWFWQIEYDPSTGRCQKFMSNGYS